jgi:hypothetical protein
MVLPPFFFFVITVDNKKRMEGVHPYKFPTKNFSTNYTFPSIVLSKLHSHLIKLLCPIEGLPSHHETSNSLLLVINGFMPSVTCMSSSGNSSIPLMTLSPNPALKLLSSSIT